MKGNQTAVPDYYHIPALVLTELLLPAFELPKWLVEPAVRSCRLINTALDLLFYDVPTLCAALAERTETW